MPVFYCKNCSQKMRAADNVIGKQCRCKKCNTLRTIPASDEVPPASLAAQSDEPPPLPVNDDAGEPPPLPSRQADSRPAIKTARPSTPPAERRNGLLIGAAALAVLLVAGIWFAMRPSARDTVAATNRGSTVNAAATSNTAPAANTTEQNPQALRERCFEWLNNWSVAIRGAQPTWQFPPQSTVEQADREVLEKSAARNARMSAEARAFRDAGSGQVSKEPLPPKVDWNDQDNVKTVALREKISEWGYAVLCETKEPAIAARETATRMGAGRVEDILNAKYAKAKQPEMRAPNDGASTPTAAGNLTFEVVEQPLQKVAEFLETLTKRKISVDPKLADKEINITINDLKLDETLKRIAASVNADVNFKDERYFINEKAKAGPKR